MHTPGPWTWALDRDVNGNETGYATVLVPDHSAPNDYYTAADAQLMAAAPDLLNALRFWDTGCFCHQGPRQGCECCGCLTRAAIAKAEGR